MHPSQVQCRNLDCSQLKRLPPKRVELWTSRRHLPLCPEVECRRWSSETSENKRTLPTTKWMELWTQTNGVPKEMQGVPSVLRPAIVSPATGVSQVRLGVPKVMSHFDYTPGEKSGVVLEARNGAGQSNPSRITLSRGKTILWVDYVPRAVLLVTGNDVGFAAGCEDGSVITWNKTGRRLLPPIILEAQPCFLESQGNFMLCITSVGMLHIW